MKTADLIRHTGCDHLGSFAPVLEKRGYRVRILEPFADDLSAHDATAADLLIVMGGAISVNDEPLYPFIRDELDLIERRMTAGKPLLGACLGGQMIAKASGARVYKNKTLEIGYHPLTLTEAGQQSCLTALEPNGYRIMHWHSDAFDLPAGATRLAYSDLTENQAFSMGPNVLAMQFHMEACPRTVGAWSVAYVADLKRIGVSPREIRAWIDDHGEAAGQGGARTIDAWLDQVEG